jgi:hypothetical protein
MCNCTSEVRRGTCHRAALCADPLAPPRNDNQFATIFSSNFINTSGAVTAGEWLASISW